jgi:hypothetical protein
MNLSKIEGEFQEPEHLFKSILKEYFQYDEKPFQEISQEDNCLVSNDHIIKIDRIEHILIFTIVNKISSIPIILHVKLFEIFVDSHLSFPLKITSLKDIVKKEELSTFLTKLKNVLFPNNLDITESNQREVKVEPIADINVNNRTQELNSFNQDPSTSIGKLDVDPFAATPGLIGSTPYNFVPAAGGMIVGPDHPMFTNPHRDRIQSSFPAGSGTLPIGSIPPGARFDPISPFGPQPGFPNRPSGGFAARPLNRRPPFSGDPDNDAFLPPGQNNFF